VEATTPEDWERFCSLKELTPEIMQQHRPDRSAMFSTGPDVAGRCSLWWTNTPPHASQRLGLIGHYAADTAQTAARMLSWATEHLTAEGCTLAVGPMDGNTWRRYRLLSERGAEPLFFLEPDNPDDWPGHFLANGFTPLAHYYSAMNMDLEHEDPRLAEVARRLDDSGVTIRPLKLEQFDDELRSIYDVSLASFQSNFLYTPIDLGEFLAQYRGVRPYVRPELVLIAEQEGKPIGYVFGIPDLCLAQRGQPIDTVIVKTLAVHPRHGGAGLGGWLTACCHRAARQLGYRRAIHALMHETNKSRRISGHTARPFRRYTLYARELKQRS
jgi:GNAT superfamily N-acetyltransferase